MVSYRPGDERRVYPRSGSADRGSNRAGSRNASKERQRDLRPRTVLASRHGYDQTINQDTLQVVRTSSVNADLDMNRTVLQRPNQFLILQPEDLKGRSTEQDSLMEIAQNVASKTQRSV